MCNLVVPKFLRTLNIGIFSKTSTNFFSNIIYETIRTREEKGIVRPDLINLLLETRKEVKEDESDTFNETADIGNFKQYRKITDEDIASQAFVFYFGGFDTVASSTCFGSYELAFNKDIQDKLREEIRKTNEENDGKLTYDVLMQMKYLDMVVSEIQRKWPIGVFLDRICTKPYTIQPVEPGESPVQLNVGDSVWLPVQGIHRDPMYYKNPNKFDPERFSDENQRNIRPATYLPFGAGPRNCIGSRFALVEIKALLFHLLLHYEIVPTAKTNFPIKLNKKSFLPIAGEFYLGLKRIKK